MKSFKIQTMGKLMTSLLAREDFDSFLLESASITTFANYSIDGHMQKDFFEDSEALSDFSSWSVFRPFCHEIIKGKRTPLSFSINLLLDNNLKSHLLSEYAGELSSNDIQSLNLFIRYDGNKLSLVSASSLKLFTLDKSIDQLWDKYIIRLLDNMGIDYIEE